MRNGVLLLICIVIGLMSGCSTEVVPNQYDVKLKAKQECLQISLGGQTAQVEVSVDSYVFQELSSDNGVFLSYHILSPEGEMLDYDGIRTSIEPIKARDKKNEIVNVTAPLSAGEYILEIDMIREGVSWFSEQGMVPLRIPMEVIESYEPDYQRIILSSETDQMNVFYGDVIEVPVSIENLSDMPLYSSGRYAIRGSYRIKDQNGNVLGYEGKRTVLPAEIPPGKKDTVVIAMNPAPFEELGSGEYIIEVDLVIEGVTWFSQKGMIPLEIPLTITELQPSSVPGDIFSAEISESSIQDADENVSFLWNLIKQTEHNTNREIQIDLENEKRNFYGYAAGDNYPQFWVRDNNTAVYAARYLNDVSFLNSWIELHLMHQDSWGGYSGLG